MCSLLWLCAVPYIVGWVWVCCYSSSATMYYAPLHIPKDLIRLSVELLCRGDPPLRLHFQRKTKHRNTQVYTHALWGNRTRDSSPHCEYLCCLLQPQHHSRLSQFISNHLTTCSKQIHRCPSSLHTLVSIIQPVSIK